MRLAIENLAIVGEELAIRWNDGRESYIGLEQFRRRCPCAQCAGEKGILGEVYRSDNRLSAESFRLLKCAIVGGYAIQPEWADRHNSGIYSFDYLRSINLSPEPEN
ncbi:MAG TPA: DUF971 domain-containing protein [Chthoniobacterales bacterium]|nr:DUF971 domain-containing protein [Chthoniobacterales bacterium]